jgi:hypothetical protein
MESDFVASAVAVVTSVSTSRSLFASAVAVSVGDFFCEVLRGSSVVLLTMFCMGRWLAKVGGDTVCMLTGLHIYSDPSMALLNRNAVR